MEKFIQWAKGETMLETGAFTGKKVDGIVIGELLGRGGMASVYRGHEEELDRTVAIKILPDEALDDSEALKRFEREARLVARINHGNVAQIHRIGRIEQCPYYAMEYIEGRSLAQVLADDGPLSPLKAIGYMIQTAQGLKAAARHGIIHRDIKPANIMLTGEEVIKIVDFGIAKAHKDETYKTMAGAVVGTPRYMSPEQGRGIQTDFRSDIYSLGATFYHLLAGKPPFEADNAITLIMKQIEDPVRSIKLFNPRVPDRLCHIIYGMLAKRPDERFGSYDDLITALNKVFQTGESPTLPPGQRQPNDDDETPEERPLSRKPVTWVATGLAVMAIAMLAGWMFRPSQALELSGQKQNAAAMAAEDEIKLNPKGLGQTLKTLHELEKMNRELRADSRED